MDDATALAAIRRFERGLRAQVTGDVQPLPFGLLVVTEDLANVYDLNYALVAADAHVDPAEVRAVAERELARRGARHVQVVYEDGTPMDAATSTFPAPVWERADHVVMRLRRHARPPWPDRATLLDAEQVDRLRRTLTQAREHSDREALADSLVEYGRRMRVAANAQVVGVLDDLGELAGWAWVHRGEVDGAGSLRQVEEVEVLGTQHGQGLGGVLMQAALHLALADDPDVVFLVAEADDWPKHWYERLGFEVIGTAGLFLRQPARTD